VTEKLYLDAQQLLEDSFELAYSVLQSGFVPTFVAAVWRGGAPMGIAVQELLAYHGIETDHIAIRSSSYHAIDDVFDSGQSIDAIVTALAKRTRKNLPHDIRVAVTYYKPSRNRSTRVPDYYVHETEAWLKFPHSLEGLSPAEVAENRPDLYQILQQANLPDT